VRHAIQEARVAKPFVIEGILGKSASRDVLLGFAPANLLHSLSFADILDEETGRGYQRKLNPQHSVDFRKYIQVDGSSTIPLTFNLRPRSDSSWSLDSTGAPHARLIISPEAGKVFAQVDCQHRLGYLNDLAIPLAFMCYIGLSEREEMEVFSIINSKAKGLRPSLLDFHDASLAGDLAKHRPELFISLQLNTDPDSPWYRQLDLGGKSTSGLTRRASLRTMQKAVRKFLNQTAILQTSTPEVAAQVVLDFWAAVAVVLRQAWDNPRRHLVSKGVGVYAMMAIAGDLYMESGAQACDKRYFVAKLSEFITDVNWRTSGPLKGFGGEGGVKSALSLLRDTRAQYRLRVVRNA